MHLQDLQTPVRLAAARALLEASALPTDDLDDPGLELLGAFDEEGALAGVIGLQPAGRTALLRSLAVAPDRRGAGIAALLCDHVVERARQRGHDELYLLTTSAAGYFERRGFAKLERAQAPDEIRATSQFSSLCPASAVVMRLAL